MPNMTKDTDGLQQCKYKSLGHLVRQFTHLKMMKCLGRGNVKASIQSTTPRELALKCPACPIPGINLPPDWDSAPPEFQ